MNRKQEDSQRQWHAGEGQRVRLTSELDVDQIQFGHEEGNRYGGRCPWLRYELMSSEGRMQCRGSRDDDQSEAERQGTSAGAQPGHGGEHAHHESEDHRAEDHRAEDHRAEDHRAEDHRAEDHRAEDQFASLHRAEDHRAEDQRAEDNPLPSLAQPSPVQVVPIHWPPDQAVNDVEACHHVGAFQGLPWMSYSPEITLPSVSYTHLTLPTNREV